MVGEVASGRLGFSLWPMRSSFVTWSELLDCSGVPPRKRRVQLYTSLRESSAPCASVLCPSCFDKHVEYKTVDLQHASAVARDAFTDWLLSKTYSSCSCLEGKGWVI